MRHADLWAQVSDADVDAANLILGLSTASTMPHTAFTGTSAMPAVAAAAAQAGPGAMDVDQQQQLQQQ